MARSHHRKKHKSHVRQFKQSHDSAVSSGGSGKGKATSIFVVGGAVAAFAISYFATGGAWLWMGLITLAGGIIGYYFGHKMDRSDGK
ncbi:MAG TPA: hypothetical protein PKC72_06310 [Chitinophagaceae bacterium]|nr:hypothetical protein [Chitinophagaceae bacterium]